jgi:ribonuclease T2
MANPRKSNLPNINPRAKITIGSLIIAVLAIAYHVFIEPKATPPNHGAQRSAPQEQGSRRGPASGNNTAGNYDYLTLVLSWSPTFCAEQDNSGRDNSQCNGSRPYAFVLHGLWPQNNNGWPESCATASKPWVPKEVIDSLSDIMPSRALVIHEYRKHGTCSGLDAREYFTLARKLYTSIRVPESYIQLRQQIVTSIPSVKQEFLQANSHLTADMLAVSCTRGGSTPRLQEVRICFDRTGKPRSCGDNERQSMLCRADRLTVPPVR